MSGSVNKVTLLGHLGRDPDVRKTQAGDKVVTLSIATSETWRDKATGERKESTEWHTVVIFNQPVAEIAEKYLRKGSKAYVVSQQKTRKWKDGAGVDRWSTETVLTQYRGELVLLDKSDRPAPDPDSYGTTQSRDAPPAGRAGEIDDEIPF